MFSAETQILLSFFWSLDILQLSRTRASMKNFGITDILRFSLRYSKGFLLRELGTHRRRGQAGSADGLRAGVQRRVLGLVQDGVHAERLLAVHRHHDCRGEGGSLSVVLDRLRFGLFFQKKRLQRATGRSHRGGASMGRKKKSETPRRSNSETPADLLPPSRLQTPPIVKMLLASGAYIGPLACRLLLIGGASSLSVKCLHQSDGDTRL